MGITTTGAATRWSVRPYGPADASVVLALINADQLPGQPVTSAGMLAEALAGRSLIDAVWWAELDAPVTDVVQDESGAVLGAVSYAVRSSDGAGLVLWLHCREEQQLAERLVAHVLDRFGARTVFAFAFASALTLGLEGLPVRHRPATREALEKAGFTGRDLWRYMCTDLPVAGLPHAVHCTVGDCEDPPGKSLTVRDTGKVVAEATTGHPVDRIGVLWWISVVPAARGTGLGLLGTALDLLGSQGAREAILFVDDDAPGGEAERNRTAANRLYDRAGFPEVDRLFSFTRRP